MAREATAPEGGSEGRKPRRERGERGERGDKKGERGAESDLIEKLVSINRVSKTVKGGKRFGFAALMVVGDGRGRVGFGTGKAREVPEAVQKATADARRHMIRVPLREARTIHHDTFGRCGSGRVYLRSAPQGTGIIAGGPCRAVFEALGIQDIVAKAIGSSNPHSMVNATFAALQSMESPRQVAARRSKKVSEIVAVREESTGAAEKAATAAEEGSEE